MNQKNIKMNNLLIFQKKINKKLSINGSPNNYLKM